MDATYLVINVEADDRTALFPVGKSVSHIQVQARQGDRVGLEATFAFNESQASNEVATLDSDDAASLARAIIDAAVQGRTQHVIGRRIKIYVGFSVHGFTIAFDAGAAIRELFISAAPVLRLARGILLALDRLEMVAQTQGG